jgi:hypothetical protein
MATNDYSNISPYQKCVAGEIVGFLFYLFLSWIFDVNSYSKGYNSEDKMLFTLVILSSFVRFLIAGACFYVRGVTAISLFIHALYAISGTVFSGKLLIFHINQFIKPRLSGDIFYAWFLQLVVIFAIFSTVSAAFGYFLLDVFKRMEITKENETLTLYDFCKRCKDKIKKPEYITM